MKLEQKQMSGLSSTWKHQPKPEPMLIRFCTFYTLSESELNLLLQNTWSVFSKSIYLNHFSLLFIVTFVECVTYRDQRLSKSFTAEWNLKCGECLMLLEMNIMLFYFRCSLIWWERWGLRRCPRLKRRTERKVARRRRVWRRDVCCSEPLLILTSGFLNWADRMDHEGTGSVSSVILLPNTIRSEDVMRCWCHNRPAELFNTFEMSLRASSVSVTHHSGIFRIVLMFQTVEHF